MPLSLMSILAIGLTPLTQVLQNIIVKHDISADGEVVSKIKVGYILWDTMYYN